MKKSSHFRIKKGMLSWEKMAFSDGARVIIGLDEAGRGPLAGPVVAAAVCLGPLPLKRFAFPRYKARIDDSKKLRPSQRKKAFYEISKSAIYGIGIKDNKYIDRKNINKATQDAMREAVSNLIREIRRLNYRKRKQLKGVFCVLVDGNVRLHLPYKTIQILKGDSKSLSIACASIIAKVTRDRIMESYDKEYPAYGFFRHKGYGTKLHFRALERYGPCPIHRKSFAPISLKDYNRYDNIKDTHWRTR